MEFTAVVFWDSAKSSQSLGTHESLPEGLEKAFRRPADPASWGENLSWQLLPLFIFQDSAQISLLSKFPHFCSKLFFSLLSSWTVYMPVNTFVWQGTYLFAYLPLSQDLQLPKGKRYCISSVFRYIFFPPHFYISEIKIAFDDGS